MNINKLRDFRLSEVTKMNEFGVILIDESHYIGSFLSTTELAPITKGGLRYEVISEVDPLSELATSTAYSVPTGVISEDPSKMEHKAFRFHRFLIFNRIDFESKISLYSGDELLAEITGFDVSERLILITDQLVTPQVYHTSGDGIHDFDSYFLSQSRINEFNTVTDLDRSVGKLGNKSRLSVPSAFVTHLEHTKLVYDVEYLLEGNPLDKFILDEDRLDAGMGLTDISREFNENTTPILSDKFK